MAERNSRTYSDEIGCFGRSSCFDRKPFWSWFETVDINVLGFVIVAVFVVTWAIALVIWRLGRIEERWSAHLENSGAVD